MTDAALPIDPAVGASAPAIAAAPIEPAAAALQAPASDAPLVDTPKPAEAAPAAPDAPAAEDPKLTPTLLEKADAERKAVSDAAAAKADEKPAETTPDKPKDDAAKPAEPAKPEEVAKPPEGAPVEILTHAFELPETLRADNERMDAFRGILKETALDPVAAGQKLIDLHAEAMNVFAAETLRNQITTFNKTKADWETRILADPEFGGSGHQTATQAVARARDNLISSARPGTEQYKRDLAEYEEFVSVTGAGSHPAFWRMLHNAARFVDEPQARSIPTDIKPPKGIGRNPRAGMYSQESLQKMNGAS